MMSLVKSNHDQQNFTRDGSVGRAAPRFYFSFLLRGMVLDSTAILWEEWVNSLRTTLNE